MSYSFTGQGALDEIIDQWEKSYRATPEEQKVPALYAHVFTTNIADYFPQIFGAELNDNTKINLTISGHKQTPGTAKSYLTISISLQ